MSRQKQRILLIQNVPTPYRRPVFEELGSQFNLEVAYCKAEQEHRNWDIQRPDQKFTEKFFWHFNLYFIWTPGLLWLLFKNQYDGIIVGDNVSTLPTTIVTLIYSKLFSIPFLVWVEAIETEYSANQHPKLVNRLLRIIRGTIYRNASIVMTLSQKATLYATQCNAPPEKIRSIIQIYPEEIFDDRDHNKPKSIGSDRITILFMGYLREAKGIRTLINAYRQIAAENTELVIVGDGPLQDQVIELAADRDDIYLPGYTDTPEQYYQWSDILVLPTLHDAWGLVINEALYYELPVITTTAAGASCIVDDCGKVVTPGSSKDLSIALSELLDENVRSHMVERAKSRSDITDSSKMAQDITDIIDEVGE